MIRPGACLILMILGLAQPAQACAPNGGSTFCADGWIAQPTAREQDQPPAPDQDTAWSGDGGRGDGAPLLMGDDGVYVEGAVVIGDAPPAPDADL